MLRTILDSSGGINPCASVGRRASADAIFAASTGFNPANGCWKQKNVHGGAVKFVPENLRRHVPVRPGLARHREVRVHVLRHLVAHGQGLGQTEIANLEPHRSRQHQVARLQIAVNHRKGFPTVEVAHPSRDVQGHLERDAEGERDLRLAEQLVQRPRRHQPGVRLDGRPEELHDVRMMQLTHELQLRPELRLGDLVVV
eukprot:27730-Pelagococcus_subviridis.AAC.4